MKNLQIYDYNKYNNSKKTIVAFMLEHVIDKSSYAVNTRYFFNTLNILNKDFNIILISKNSGDKWIDIARSNDLTSNFIYMVFDNETKKYYNLPAGKMSHKEKHEYINETLDEFSVEYSELYNSIVGTINSSNTIASLDLNVEILSDGDENLLKKQKRASNKYKKSFENDKLIGHTAFIYKPYGFGYTFLQYLMKNKKDVFHYCFAHATNSLWIIYTKNYNPFTKNVKSFYHINQFKENREFVEFPMAALQDCYLNSDGISSLSDYNEILNSKEIDFVFGGLFPHDIPARCNAWYKYFDDLNSDNIKIRTQTNTGWKINDKKFTKEIKEDEPQILKDIKSHKKVENTLPYDEYNQELKKSMFTLLIECYPGKYDHFTLRFISAIYFGCLPLISEEYDVNELQIPKEFRNKLLVKNAKDIEEKINYYKNNIEEYKTLFRNMWNFYIKEDHFKTSYYEEEFKNNLFSELYK